MLKSVTYAEILVAKYLLIANRVAATEVTDRVVDDLFKASPRELPYLFRAISVLLSQPEVNREPRFYLLDISERVVRLPAKTNANLSPVRSTLLTKSIIARRRTGPA